MYEGLRLTELHEEVGWYGEIAKRTRANGQCYAAAANLQRAIRADAEIRVRVAAQEIGFRPPERWRGRLAYGIPDAERVYPAKRRTYATNGVDPLQGWPVEHYPAHWTNHKTHAVPAEGCHLCREGKGSL